MTILKAIILGFVQGVTEFLPISSSGHLSVFQHFMKTGGENSLLFTVLLHIGTLVAVLAVYYKTVIELIKEAFFVIRDVFARKFSFKKMNETRHMLFMFIISCVPLLFLLIPIGGDRILMDFFSGLAEDDDIFVEGFCFLFTAFLLLVGTRRAQNIAKLRPRVEPKDAVAIGFAQVLAAGFPGISRSGSTISTGLFCGVSKGYLVRYSFVLGIPAILAASAIEVKDAVAQSSSIEILPTIIGVAVAALVGIVAIKILEWLVKSDKFKFFGYYCLTVGIVVIIAAILEKVGIITV
ncbi:MAG TPA: undecaprenyl-diphosphate phosphatase [Clostridia bacterium]|nr:undecaprenyl-diphosphate phosphatase [Clostridia bacterium]